MDDHEALPPRRRRRAPSVMGAVALAVLALAGGVVVLVGRSAPTAPTSPTQAPPVDAGLVPERTASMRAAIDAVPIGPALRPDPPPASAFGAGERRSGRLAVDRIVSLAYAWQHGAADWTAVERAAFARDRANQVVVDARSIVPKAGRGPSGWLPPEVAIRCAYVARFAEVVAAYGLTMTADDQEIARRQCR